MLVNRMIGRDSCTRYEGSSLKVLCFGAEVALQGLGHSDSLNQVLEKIQQGNYHGRQTIKSHL
jgi:hypothetical protein